MGLNGWVYKLPYYSQPSHYTETPDMTKIVSIFLIQFDVKIGYKVLWNKTSPGVSIDGIEFKCLPSGIHEFAEDLVLFTHYTNGQIYYGISKFRLNLAISRNDTKMFSLGCLCLSDSKENWKPNEFVSNGFEYVSYLDELLVDYINTEDYTKLNQQDFHTIKSGKFTSPLIQLPNFFNKFGPLIFLIFKFSVLRKRIIIFNKSKHDNYNLQCFNYIISIMSLKPNKMKIETPGGNGFTQPLYNICLHDIESPLLKLSSFIATTNDDILMYKPIYDIGIIVDSDSPPQIIKFEDIANPKRCLKSTFNDYTKFKIIYEQLANQESFNNKSVDNISINTTSSFMNKFFKESKISYEPNWWLHDSTYPISWTQYIWSAFSWFASAGQMNAEDIEPLASRSHAEIDLPNLHSGRSSLQNFRTSFGESDASNDNLMQFVIIIGYFHKLMKKWIYLASEVVGDDVEESVIFNYQDLIDMELDPYCKDDVSFIKEFVNVYWGRENIDVSSGLSFIC